MKIALALLSLLLVGGCKPPPKRQKTKALCSVARPLTKAGQIRPLRPDDWFNLLVDRAVDGKNADCTGAALAWQQADGCAEVEERGDPVAARAFREDDVLVQRVDEGTKLVWVITDFFSNGDGMGPVSLVSEEATTIEVLAVGTLKARARRPRLKLIQIGETEMLSAEGEACEREDEPASCRRSIVLMERRGPRFLPLRLYARNGLCLGPAAVHMARQKTLPLDSGWTRRLELHSTLLAQPQRLLVTEQVVVSDFDPTRPGVPPRPVRRADAEILYWFGKDGRLYASDASLWSRILEQIDKDK
jgi:hypothetical protein